MHPARRRRKPASGRRRCAGRSSGQLTLVVWSFGRLVVWSFGRLAASSSRRKRLPPPTKRQSDQTTRRRSVPGHLKAFGQPNQLKEFAAVAERVVALGAAGEIVNCTDTEAFEVLAAPQVLAESRDRCGKRQVVRRGFIGAARNGLLDEFADVAARRLVAELQKAEFASFPAGHGFTHRR